jgi:allantoate deiminase
MTELAETEEMTRAAAAIAECRLLATMSEEPERTTRRFLTPPVAAVHAHLRARMQTLEMTVHTDAAGNLRGLWQPAAAREKRLLLGSHIDTVPNAGAFDGVLGVVLALEWVRLAQELEIPRAIEVIAFSEEEGVRYGVPFLGSRAVAGIFDPKMLAYEDVDGIRMDDAIRAFGLDPVGIPGAVLDDAVLGYVEIHIEQGPVLEAEGLSLAVVEGIVGQTRLGFRFTGQANHAGTTPMNLRRDALAAAAEWMTAVETAARETEGLVATVGKIRVEPDAGNVIPGVVDVSLDVRHMSNRTRSYYVRQFVSSANAIAHRRGLEVEWVEKMNERSVLMDANLSSGLLAAVETAGFPARRMPSGAGHDAMVIAARVPAAMLFLRSPGGISHHPAEDVLEEDVEAALKVGGVFLQQLAR